jgi:transposase
VLCQIWSKLLHLNSKIKTIKVRSRGFRNKERFKNAIYFHLGGLDLYPDGIA